MKAPVEHARRQKDRQTNRQSYTFTKSSYRYFVKRSKGKNFTETLFRRNYSWDYFDYLFKLNRKYAERYAVSLSSKNNLLVFIQVFLSLLLSVYSIISKSYTSKSLIIYSTVPSNIVYINLRRNILLK